MEERKKQYVQKESEEREWECAMSEVKKNGNSNIKSTVAAMLREAETVYVILSQCTRLPYVLCDTETYDDEIFLFLCKEDALHSAEGLREKGHPVQVIKVEKKNFLPFYVSLMPMGVNCILVNPETPEETAVQLSEIIRRQESADKVLIENPQLHLTAIYFMQRTRKIWKTETLEGQTEDLGELQEEMLAHYQRGRYIVPVKEDMGMLVLKQKDGRIFQPVFTDIQEFQKFAAMNQKQKFKTAVFSADKIPEILAPQAAGVVINPLGVNLQLQIRH